MADIFNTKKIRGKLAVMALLVLIAGMCILLISLTAYSSTLQYEINSINNKISQSEWQQRNLEAKIKSSSNLQSLEARATEMGLVYPTFDDIVYLTNEENTVHDLAQTLRESAYVK